MDDATPIVSLIVAVAENGVIGRGGKLPWRLKSDLRRFRALTIGHPMIMGRITFESIGRPLDGRDNIVISRTASMSRADDKGQTLSPTLVSLATTVDHAQRWDKALSLAKAAAARRGVAEIFVIGGATVFNLALCDADRLYLTRVHASPDGDVIWNPPSLPDWHETSRTHRPRANGDDYDVTDLILERAGCSQLPLSS